MLNAETNNPFSSLGLSGEENTTLLIGIAIFGLVLVAAGVWFYLRTKSNPAQETEPAGSTKDVEINGIDDRESVMDAILALDDLYKEGQLPEDAYLERRAELKSHLKQLVESEEQDT